jgi:hypothetical protein
MATYLVTLNERNVFFLFLNLKYFFELIIKINQSKKKEGKNLKKKTMIRCHTTIIIFITIISTIISYSKQDLLMLFIGTRLLGTPPNSSRPSLRTIEDAKFEIA